MEFGCFVTREVWKKSTAAPLYTAARAPRIPFLAAIFQKFCPKPKKCSKRILFKKILVSELVAIFFRTLEKNSLRAFGAKGFLCCYRMKNFFSAPSAQKALVLLSHKKFSPRLRRKVKDRVGNARSGNL